MVSGEVFELLFEPYLPKTLSRPTELPVSTVKILRFQLA